MKKILAFSGSNNPDSINEKLVQSIVTKYKKEDIRFVDLKKFNVPIYSQEIQAQRIPNLILELYDIFQESEGFIIASPEHNGLPSAFFKNIIDWLSVINQRFFGEKPVLLISTSPGAVGGNTHVQILAKLVSLWGGKLMASYSLGSFQNNFDAAKMTISNANELQKLDKACHAFFAQKPLVNKTNTEVVQSYFEAFGSGNTEKVLQIFHPDCYIVSVKETERTTDQLHGIYNTRTEAKQFLATISNLFETKDFTVDTIAEAEGNLVVAKGTFSHLVKRTGKLFQSNWVQLCIIEDTMIKEYRFYEDSAALLEASLIAHAS